jgi:hypothetical protein
LRAASSRSRSIALAGDAGFGRNAADARICSYECTFCAECVEKVLFNVCPNCGGGFAPRPIRPVVERRPGVCIGKQPESAKRVHLKWSREEIAEFARRVRDIHSENR